jgi:hypothetical protein
LEDTNTTSWYFNVEITRCGISKWEKRHHFHRKFFVSEIFAEKEGGGEKRIG